MIDNKNQTSQKLHSKERGTEIASFGIEGSEVARRVVSSVVIVVVIVLIVSRLLSLELELSFESAFEVFLPIIFLGVIFYLLFPLIQAKMNNRNTVIYSNGIARNDNFYAWKDIDGVMGNHTFVSVIFFPAFMYGAHTLYQNSQAILKIKPFDGRPEQQYQHINQALIRTHLDELVKTIEAGGALEFQPVTVEADGLHFGDEHLPMTEIGQIVFEEYQIQIDRKDGKDWKFFRVENFFNPYVFQALVYTLMKKAS